MASGVWMMGSHLNFYLSSVVVSTEIVNQSVRRSRRRGVHKTKRTQTYKITAGQYEGAKYEHQTFINFDSIGDKVKARFDPETGKINTSSNTLIHAVLGLLLTIFGAIMLKFRSRLG